jgi:hypothetical protein
VVAVSYLGVTNRRIVYGSEKQEPDEACVDRKRRQDADRTGTPVSIPHHFDAFNRGSHCTIPWVEATALDSNAQPALSVAFRGTTPSDATRRLGVARTNQE